MSAYSEVVSITLPYALADIAAKVGRALDPDTGGDRSFVRTILSQDGDTIVYGDTITAVSPCTAEFKAQADYMLEHPEALHAACQADYEARWPEFEPPTMEECEAFCGGAQ